MKGTTMPSLAAVLAMIASSGLAAEAERPRVEPDGTVHVPAFDLPESVYLSEGSRAAMKYFRDVYGPEFGTFSRGCPNLFEVGDDPDAARAARQCVADGYYETSIYKDTRAKHPVEITAETIAGVYTEVFVPKDGVAAANKNRLLISIHGGGFTIGARYFSHTEAMQVAHMGGYKVISPDYRMAPEFTHPAGLEDAVAVYRAMLADYDAGSIGIYGCSAGAMLTAQTVAYLLRNDLPLPGGIGLFRAGIPMTEGAVPGVFK
ncbi:MAG: alpha/beta hydrolase fold domain-containing protein, partial [Gammaproteobacteria bacterium]|nr:alpha/beta hydrolase fold domain-containing protein [Gammaproteobacteria bacterium]